MFYKTEILNHQGKIFVISDVHGDLHSFIISLRDCAKVIKKRNLNLNTLDPDIETNLKIDIKEDDRNYDESFGYKWCGENSYIVIGGDLIDPSRSNACIREDGKICGEYPQIEIKLLRFINYINKKAERKGGRIIKLLGNHEMMNILNIFQRDERDIYQSDVGLENYYRGTSRETSFNVGQPGFKLLFKDGCGMLIKINNTICVHGHLPLSLQEMDEINQFINNPNNQKEKFQELWIEKLNLEYNTKNKGPLQLREWAFPSFIDKRHQTKEQEEYCLNNVRDRLVKFMSHDNVDKLRVVVGHCPQNPYVRRNKENGTSKLEVLINTTMTYMIDSDSVSKTYSSKEYKTGLPDYKNQDTIYGITMQCPKPKQNDYTDFFVYHVDVASSRGFDWQIYYDWITFNDPKAIELENICLFSKTPQVLSIEIDKDGEDFVTIIKSKMRNTRIHLPRPNYEELINAKNIKSLKLDNSHYHM